MRICAGSPLTAYHGPNRHDRPLEDQISQGTHGSSENPEA